MIPYNCCVPYLCLIYPMQDINFYNTSVHLILAKEKALPYLKTLVLSTWGGWFFILSLVCSQKMLHSGFALMVVR